jgi:hypothetical protein
MLYARLSRDSLRTFGWIDAVMVTPLKDHLEVNTSNIMDPRELYIGQIFYPERFSVSVILKALNVSIHLYSMGYKIAQP